MTSKIGHMTNLRHHMTNIRCHMTNTIGHVMNIRCTSHDMLTSRVLIWCRGEREGVSRRVRRHSGKCSLV